MAYTKSVADRNRKNADLRPDGKGGLVHKDKLPKSKRETAREKLRNGRKTSKTARQG